MSLIPYSIQSTNSFAGTFIHESASTVGALLCGHSTSVIESHRDCANGLLAGTVASFIAKHPLPFFLGLSECLPVVRAQQPVRGEFQVNTHTAGNQWYPTVAALSTGNFVVTW